MRRILTAGAMAYELLFAANAAEARDRQSDHVYAYGRHMHASARQSAGMLLCDERRCVEPPTTELSAGFGDSLVMLAQSQLGNGAIYGRSSLWCGRFMNWTLAHAGYRGTGSDLAKSFLKFPRTSPHVGAIAVFSRGGRSGHVGLVTGFDTDGNPIIISGNHGHRVARGVYPRRRVIAYVSPR
jgi:uncharacterized protein (TIGR02594 family)